MISSTRLSRSRGRLMRAERAICDMGEDHLAMRYSSLFEDPPDAMEAHFFVKADNRNLSMEVNRLNRALPSELDSPF